MDETVEIDGSILNVKKQYCFTEENGKVRYEECYIISKNDKVIMRCPVREKALLLQLLAENADMGYYRELKQN